MMEKGLFRKDLFYRLGVIKVRVPSLNERPEDILPLAKHFLMEFNQKFDKRFTRISPQTEDALIAYQWTGNVRELKNLIERGVLIGRGPELTLKDIGMESTKNSGEMLGEAEGKRGFTPIPIEGMDLQSAQESFERYYIKEALRMARGNESKAARLLRINHHTFRYRSKKLGIK
jgi:DNA-binding NtrC family response regulator